MRELMLQPTSLAQWYALVNEAEAGCALDLGEELESYLVFLLMRFTERPEISTSFFALEFLESLHKLGSARNVSLQEVGDKCLLYSGFFPEQIQKRRLKESYYIDLGQNAYYALASISKQRLAELYQNLCESFLQMRDVLQAMRPDETEFLPLLQNPRVPQPLIFRKPRTKH